jgi:hypothetical protein
MRDSKGRVERQNLSCSLDRSQQNPLGIAFWKSLVIEPDVGHSKHRDQEANPRSEQSRSTPEPFDLRGQLDTIMGREIASADIARAAMNPTSSPECRKTQQG